MNTAIILGRLVSKPELRYTKSEKAVVSSCLAVDRQFKNEKGEKETDFINFQIWGKQAENLVKYCDKGSMIALKGEIRTEKWTDTEQKTRVNVFVLGSSVTFLNSPKNSEKEQIKEEPKKISDDVFADFGNTVEIDNIDVAF